MFKTPASLAQIAAIIVAVSMTFSPFLLSVGIWLLVAIALWEASRVVWERDGGIRWQQVMLYSWQKLTAERAYLVLGVLFWVVCFSMFWSSNWSFGLERLRIRIPFLVLPWAVANLPSMTVRQYSAVIVALVISMVLICMGVWLNFLLDRETILSGLGEGQPIPVPRHHIRFSLMMVIAILSGGWLFSKKSFWRSAGERWFFGGALVFLLLFLHFLSVRSAIVALYAATFYTLVRFLYLTRRWKAGLIALSILIITPIIAVTTVQSLQQRIAYMLYDWQHYKSKEGGESYSDSERFVSLYVGWSIWEKHPVLGSGAGDLEAETLQMTEALYQEYSETPKLPHNQFIYILASTGLLGLAISLFAFLFPLANQVYREHYLFMSFQVVVFVSFLVEYTLETSIGAAFYLFYQLWFMRIAEVAANTEQT